MYSFFIFFSAFNIRQKKHGRIRACHIVNLGKRLHTKTNDGSPFNNENCDSRKSKEQSNDGQTFLPVLEEQADEAQQETNSTQNQANDIKNRNPTYGQTNQRQDKAGNAATVFSFCAVTHVFFPKFVSGATFSL